MLDLWNGYYSGTSKEISRVEHDLTPAYQINICLQPFRHFILN